MRVEAITAQWDKITKLTKTGRATLRLCRDRLTQATKVRRMNVTLERAELYACLPNLSTTINGAGVLLGGRSHLKCVAHTLSQFTPSLRTGRMDTQDGIILLDPHPRTLDLIFSPEDKARLERLGRVVWHEGSPADDEHIEKYLHDTVAIIGQTPMPRERLERAPRLRMIANVESNFLPNVDYEECHRRNVHVVATGPVFAQPVAEMALGMALSCARRIHEADASVRRGDESLYGEADNYDSFLLKGKTLGLLGCGNLG